MQSVVIILSAGMGTRMQSDLPKVLHKVACEPLLIHSMRTASQFGANKTIVVFSDGEDHEEQGIIAAKKADSS